MSTEPSTTASETGRICEFVVNAEYGDLSRDAVEHATKMIVDSVGVTLAAVDDPVVAAVRDTYPEAFGVDGEARVLGTGDTGSVWDVALLTGTMAHALDFDDVHHEMGGHPSAPVLSALLPVSERRGASGRELLRSFVLGTEVEVTLAKVLNPGLYERGWHPTAVVGTLGAAVAVGDLLDLDAAGLRRAVGIAASRAAGIKGNFGTMTKPLHVGFAARNGLEAAELAAGGVTADERILELEFGGFCDLFQGDEPYEFEPHLNRLGEPWGLLSPPVGFKPYPCCGSTHSAVDAALELHERCSLSADEIEAIEICEYPRRLGHTNDPEPETSLDAKFSVQYCVAVALCEGNLWFEHFDEEVVQSDRYRALLKDVEVTPDESAFVEREWAARVTVSFDADEQTATVEAPKGSAERPMTADELETKYRRCASIALDDGTDESLRALRDLESVDDVSAVVDLLV